ncbi:hypothetical protein ACS0TY_014287 [Phlomoides rotata]
MEVSVIGSSQVNLGRINDVGFSRNLSSKICNLKNNHSNFNLVVQNQSFLWPSRSGFSLRVSASAHNEAVVSDKSSRITRTKLTDGVKLYVGLPLDTVSSCNTISHARGIATGLKALKLLGVDGVELPLWWGVVESEAMGKYDWSRYLDIVEMVQKLDLKLHVSLCFHASEDAQIPLPRWVSRIGDSGSSIYFTDRSGKQYKDCLSLSVDDLPVLDGKTPLQVYKDFFDNFKSTFSPFMGSTITGLSIGLGPDGELRYPSHHHPEMSKTHLGAGEFQCYDKNMLANLKHQAQTLGNPLWGLGGPHNAPSYDQSPISGTFFAENGGSWETPYGDFFLSWYSSQLINHGDRVLSLAASTFKDVPVPLSGKIPIMPSWYKARSHPSELTAGFYNTVNRDGYDSIVEMFSRNSCKVIVPGLELSDEEQSSPESVLAQVISCCRKYSAEVAGENSSFCGGSEGFEQIKHKLLGENGVMELFTYQRIGAHFFSPDHFRYFTQFVRGLNQHALPLEPGEPTHSLSPTNCQMQTA